MELIQTDGDSSLFNVKEKDFIGSKEEKQMAVNKAYTQQYQTNSIASARPEELTLMLYNGMIRYITRAQKAIEEKNLEKSHENIVWAQDILMEFQATLDYQYEISHSLLLLYDYMHRRLIDANVKKDVAILEEVLTFAVEFRDTWVQAMKIAREQTQTQMQGQQVTQINVAR